ncbi:Hsp20/alpha crystallin family protein [Propionivibrio soli]|uniref:Hsp20/alpha crystallin family protein n=1 Tax=Propionivibrio soli TaxID=2976531 RepID=UPI0021E8AA7F|nr:Hsp20/alpha crystallin family protein [Propionivibrio soli]
MYRTLFPSDFLADLERMQRQMLRFAGPASSIRGFGRSGFPALNVGTTPESIEIFAFAPGLDPATVDVTIDRGVLTVSGERKSELPSDGNKSAVHINERFNGSFRRVVSLPDDVDPDNPTAKYADGVLHIRIMRRAAAQSRRIEIQ